MVLEARLAAEQAEAELAKAQAEARRVDAERQAAEVLPRAAAAERGVEAGCFGAQESRFSGPEQFSDGAPLSSPLL